MEENLPNDPLEDLFRDALDNMEEQPAADGWDLPSTQSWKKIQRGLTPPPKRRRIFLWISGIAAALILAFFLRAFYLSPATVPQQLQVKDQSTRESSKSIAAPTTKQNSKQSTPKKKLDVPPSNVAADQLNTTNLAKTKQATRPEKNVPSPPTMMPASPKQGEGNTPATTTKSQVASQTKPLRKETQKNNTTSIVSPTPFVKTPETIAGSPYTKKPQQTETITKTTASTIATTGSFPTNEPTPSTETSATNSNRRPTNTLMTITPIASASAVPLRYENLVEMPKLSIDSPIDLPKRQSKFYLAAFVAPSLDWLAIKETKLEDQALKKRFKANQEDKFNLTAALHFGYQWNQNWSVESGLQYNYRKTTTRHPLVLRHDPTNEQTNVNGELENSYNYTLKTSYGDVDTDISVTRANAPLTAKTPLALEVETVTEQRSLGIPLLVKYQRSSKRHHFFARTGMIYTLPLANDLNITRTVATGKNVKFGKTKVKPNSKNKQAMSSLDFQVSLGFEYDLSTNIRLSISPTFTRRLTPIRFKDSAKAYQQFASLQVGASYYF